MATATRVFRALYRDSVSLMRLSASLADRPGVDRAAAMMATPANLALMAESGLIEDADDAGPDDPGPNDVIVGVRGTADAVDAALAEAGSALHAADPPPAGGGEGQAAPRSIAAAQAALPGASLVLISTPGAYAAAEAEKALRLGLDVMIFSDHVPLADEVALKTLARERGRMVMGPDCGTAIIDGVPLGFANEVRQGDVGIVAASGSGLQQVACLIDRAGRGISQAIGAGGRDAGEAVGGVTMLRGLEALAADDATTVIVLVSKPPAPEVARRILDRARNCRRPVVAAFLGADPAAVEGANLHAAATLEQAATIAVSLSREPPAAAPPSAAAAPSPPVPTLRLAPGQRFVRGLYAGGTLCHEARLLLAAAGDTARGRGHTCLDMGGPAFTRGRPHPMIDTHHRARRMPEEARDPETAVILFDVVLGHGAHPDPAGSLAPAVEAARAAAGGDGRDVAFVAHVCGTDRDPQDLHCQEARLRKAGVALAPSNARAVQLALATATGQGDRDG